MRAPRATLPPGRTGRRTVAGRWCLLDQVGAGATASVWRARDLHTGGLVAVKVLGAHTGALMARFWREQEIRLRHPHLLTATGWAAEEDVVLLTTDLVTGGTVRALLAEHGPLPEPVVARILQQTLRALAVVHAAGLVHRDVKPGNLLLEGRDDGGIHVRLGDFGVALDPSAPRLTVAGPVGTEGYLPPDATLTPDLRHDLYAVGVLGLHLLTARRPHPGGPTDPGSPWPPTRLRALLERLVAPRADDRPDSAGHALALLESLAIEAPQGAWVRDCLGPAPDEVAALAHRVHERRVRLTSAAVLLASGAVIGGCATFLRVLLG
ncbi:serine/threonine-protein kinase [Nocardioides daphniae]|uniref:non-specific serine/threonine protein kinase n=1 Tax=Nocardioides daphniae TaxID=402297 RepID=A0ABQ1Q338_9ACTN|nr:serine/threonine-protein kinase [Nocardioides daphniae]GGD11700.1 hypothetical protein GCM10007231_08190 [Nocardioides daphniae]